MALTYNQAVEQTITAGEQIHQIVNGTTTTEVTVEDGSKVPSIRKALLDNFYFKDPIAWQVGQTENVFNQLRQFTDGSWWYAPSATASNPISMGSTPIGDSLWKIYDFDAIGKLTPQLREALRRSYAEAGYNLVDGSFEAGGTLVNANDVLLQECTGKAFSGPVGVVAAGTNPEIGGFVDKSGGLLRHELATSDGAAKVGTSGANGGSVQDFIDDYDGFTAELLAQGGVPDNGLPDKLGASQRVGALHNIFTRTFANVDAMLTFNGLVAGQRYSTGGTTWEYLGGGNTIDRFNHLGFIYVNDYGAVGDGVFNDTPAIKRCIADAKLLKANIAFLRTDNYYRLIEPITVGHKCIVDGSLAELSIEHSGGDGVTLGTAIQFENFSIVVRNDDFDGWALNVAAGSEPYDRYYPSQLHVNNIYLDSDTLSYNANMLRFSADSNYGGKISRIFMGRGLSNFTRRCNNAFEWEQSNATWGTSNIVSEVYVDMNIQGTYWRMNCPDLGLGSASSNELRSIVLQARNAGTTPSLYGRLVDVDGFTNLRVSNFKVFDYKDGSSFEKPIYFNNCSNAQFSMSPDIDFTRLESNLIEIGSSTLSKMGFSTKAANSTVNTRVGKLLVTGDAGYAYPFFFPTSDEHPLSVEIFSRTDFAAGTKPFKAKIHAHGYLYREIVTYECASYNPAANITVHKIQAFREGVVIWLRLGTSYLQYECYGALSSAVGLTLTNTSGTPTSIGKELSTTGLGTTKYPVAVKDTITVVPVQT